MSTIAEAFGEDFASKHSQNRLPRLRVEGAVKQEMIKMVKSGLRPESPMLHYAHHGSTYQIVLVEMSEEPVKRAMKWGNFSIWFAKWSGRKMGLDSPDEQVIDSLQPNTAYVLVGKMKIAPKKDGNGSWYNFRIDGVISMDEIVQQGLKESVVDEF